MTRTFLLTWNPRKFRWEDLPNRLERLAQTGYFEMGWSTGNRIDLPIGSRIFLMRLGDEPKGLVASGITVSTPASSAHWKDEGANRGQKMLSVTVEFESAQEQPVLLLKTLLKGKLAGFRHWTPQSGGVEIPGNIASLLETEWSNALTTVGRRPPVRSEGSPPYPEGALRTVATNTYERSAAARRECIAHHGAVCAICGFSGREQYGPEYDGLIHIHHIKPISQLPADYRVDPVRDLVPLCPNCHAAIHWREGATTVARLRNALQRRKPRTGDRSP